MIFSFVFRGYFAAVLTSTDMAALDPEKMAKSLSMLPPHLKLQIFQQVQRDLPAKDAKEVGSAPATPPPVVLALDKLQPDKLALFSAAELKSLQTDGFIVKDKFLNSDSKVRDILSAASEFAKAGKLLPGGMKAQHTAVTWKSGDTRGDKICWLHRGDEGLPAALAGAIDSVDALRAELNAALGFGCEKTQIQLACYDGGGTRYVRHLDTVAGGPQRRLTVIYYPNDGWKPEQGGQLRLFLPSGPRDVEPVGDRLIVFLSSWLEHEVLPAQAPRFALTIWFV